MQLVPSPSEKRKNWLAKVTRVVLWTALVLFFAAAAFASWLFWYAVHKGPERAESTAVVFIPRGTSVQGIGSLLAEAGLIREDPRFIILTRLMGVSGQLQAGEFELDTNQKPVALIRQLVSARPLAHSITIPEGYRITEIAELFAKDGWADAERFIELTRNKSFIEGFGLGDISSLEGYLFPDTYNLVRPTVREEDLIRKLVDRSLQIWQDLDGAQSELSRHQVFTLASIVEKETGQASERPLIASVFLNRLKKGMKLQSDPTVIYGLEAFEPPLTRADLKINTPYNTYIIPGLPPGPICSPGRESLAAVLSPADTDYLYFVADNNGTHRFSKNLREHNRAVRAYRKARKEGDNN